MSIQINNIDVTNRGMITRRNVNLNGNHVQSVNIYQTDGSFITTQPFDNKLIWYPQSPNNVSNTLLGKWKIYDSFSGYGSLYFPLDARFDFIRRKLWIADSGNQRILGINIDGDSVSTLISNNYFSHSIAVNINNGDLYVKSIKDINTGIIQQYDKNGTFIRDFEFLCSYGTDITHIENTYKFVSSIPLPSSMVFNHVVSRLWWVGDSYVYMSDMLNKNIVPYNTYADGFDSLKSMES